MTRTSDANQINALKAREIVTCDLVLIRLGCTLSNYTSQASCELNGGVWTNDILMCTRDYPVENVSLDLGQGSEVLTFDAGADLLELPDIEESLEMDIGTVSIQISALDNDWLIKSQSIELSNRPVWIWRVLFDPSTNAMIGTPFQIFGGGIVTAEVMAIEEGEGSRVNIEVSNQFYDFKRVAGFRCNVEDHQSFYPGDTGFKFVTSVQRELKWM